MSRLDVYVDRSPIVGALEVVSLTVGGPDRLYGGMTGAHGHLFFRYELGTGPGGRGGRFVDLGDRVVSAPPIISFSGNPIPGKIHHALETLPDGRIAGATGQNYSIAGLYTDRDEGGHVFIYDPKRDASEDLGVPCPHEWLFNLTMDPAGENLYAMTYPLNHVVRVDLKRGSMRVVGQPPAKTWGDSGPCHQCCTDDDGRVFGSGLHRHIWMYDPRRDVLEAPAMRLPEGAERIDSFVRGPDHKLYAGTWERGDLLRIDPATLTLDVLGCPGGGPRLPALAWRGDGCLYGAAGGGRAYQTRSAFIFRYDPRTERIEEIGPIVSAEQGVAGERIHTMVCGPDGRLYCGETGGTQIKAGEVAMNPNLYVCTVRD